MSYSTLSFQILSAFDFQCRLPSFNLKKQFALLGFCLILNVDHVLIDIIDRNISARNIWTCHGC